jgi:hypothetical protein
LNQSPARPKGEPASQSITARIAELDDWRGETLRRVRAVIKKAVPGIVEDPSGLFNSSLEGATRRAIDIHEDEKIDARALAALLRAAVALNVSKRTVAKKKPSPARRRAAR